MAAYSKKSQQKVKKVMDEFKHGELKSGNGGKKVTDRQQAIAISLRKPEKRERKFRRRRWDWSG